MVSPMGVSESIESKVFSKMVPSWLPSLRINPIPDPRVCCGVLLLISLASSPVLFPPEDSACVEDVVFVVSIVQDQLKSKLGH